MRMSVGAGSALRRRASEHHLITMEEAELVLIVPLDFLLTVGTINLVDGLEPLSEFYDFAPAA
jgi:hypothetical protein